jgi:phosphonate transport system substrate-binding protein
MYPIGVGESATNLYGTVNDWHRRPWGSPSVVLLWMVAMAIAAAGCSTLAVADTDAVLDFTQREPLPQIGEIEPKPLRIAVGAVMSPEGTVESYSELAAYFETELGRAVEVVQRRTYKEINDLVADGSVDIAFVCTSAYVAGHDAGEMDLLVIPEIGGETVYRSVIIVPSTSTVRTIEDLRGSVFAFTDPMSHTGRVYPTYTLLKRGEMPEGFFEETIFTYGHDRSIEAVAAKVVAGAAVDDLILAHMIAADPTLADKIRIIDTSPAFGIPPVVVPSGTPASVREQFEELLIGLVDDPEGAHILSTLGVDRFVYGTDTAYNGVRLMVRETGLGL